MVTKFHSLNRDFTLNRDSLNRDFTVVGIAGPSRAKQPNACENRIYLLTFSRMHLFAAGHGKVYPRFVARLSLFVYVIYIKPLFPSFVCIKKVPEYTQRLKQFRQLFGDVHQIGVFEDRLSRDSDWILECMARLFVHSRLFQCPRFYGGAAVRNLHGADKCPGGCELRKRRPRDRKFAGRRKVKSASMRDHHHGDNPTIMTTAGWSNYQKSVYGRAKTTNSVFN